MPDGLGSNVVVNAPVKEIIKYTTVKIPALCIKELQKKN
jgi:hypothetical protein